jgi:hypothetical protein
LILLDLLRLKTKARRKNVVEVGKYAFIRRTEGRSGKIVFRHRENIRLGQ